MGETHLKSHPALWSHLWSSSPCLFVCFAASPLQNIVTSLPLPPFFLFVSFLPPSLSSLSSVLCFWMSTSRSSSPAAANSTRQRGGRGWVSRQRVQPGGQGASVFPWKAASHLFPCLPALNKRHTGKTKHALLSAPVFPPRTPSSAVLSTSRSTGISL